MADPDVAAELAMLRGEMCVGFTELKGGLALIQQAQRRTEEDTESLERRVGGLESRRVPLAPLAAVSGAVSAVAAVVAAVMMKS